MPGCWLVLAEITWSSTPTILTVRHFPGKPVAPVLRNVRPVQVTLLNVRRWLQVRAQLWGRLGTGVIVCISSRDHWLSQLLVHITGLKKTEVQRPVKGIPANMVEPPFSDEASYSTSFVLWAGCPRVWVTRLSLIMATGRWEASLWLLPLTEARIDICRLSFIYSAFYFFPGKP